MTPITPADYMPQDCRLGRQALMGVPRMWTLTPYGDRAYRAEALKRRLHAAQAGRRADPRTPARLPR